MKYKPPTFLSLLGTGREGHGSLSGTPGSVTTKLQNTAVCAFKFLVVRYLGCSW